MKRFENLKELTKADWDTIFPVELVDHNPNWKSIYESEQGKIEEVLNAEHFNQIHHFGSSSIPGIKSKPYIDILMEVPDDYMFDKELLKGMSSIGYTCLTEPGENVYMIMVKGYNLNGTTSQVFHIHACPPDHDMLRQIAFRDYLLQHPALAKAYERLKTELAVKFRNDRSGYRIAKTDFIEEALKMANIS